MFIKYKCKHDVFFYDKDKNLISGIKRGDYSNEFTFWAEDQYVCFFGFSKDPESSFEIKNFELNREHIVANYAITFLTILQKEEGDGYRYQGSSLFNSLEGPNYMPNEGDSIFRKGYYKREKDIYLSKYVAEYYPALSVSPPNFSKREKGYFWDNTKEAGEATKMYKAFQEGSKIPFTLFLKPHTRQWFNKVISLTEPGVYNCSYNYVNRELTVVNGTETTRYFNVPHTITVCCQGGGGGGGAGRLASYAGWGGAAGGFVAANCFLGNHITTFTIQVGSGGNSGQEGGSSFVQIEQTIDLTKFASNRNPTLAYYGLDYNYAKLENGLKIEGLGGGIEGTIKTKNSAGGRGIITTNTFGYDSSNNRIPTGESIIESSGFLSSLFFKPLFCLKGGNGGKGSYGASRGAGGETASFINFTHPLSPFYKNEDVIMTWNNGFLSLENASYSCNKDMSFEKPLILGGPSFGEAFLLFFGPAALFVGGEFSDYKDISNPSGGGGGSSIFGRGGRGGYGDFYDNSSKDGLNAGAIGAGGGGGKASGEGNKLGSGGNGGNGAVWLIW